MLIALVQTQNEHANDAAAEEEAWRILWDECPWLEHCDTAFSRRRTTH